MERQIVDSICFRPIKAKSFALCKLRFQEPAARGLDDAQKTFVESAINEFDFVERTGSKTAGFKAAVLELLGVDNFVFQREACKSLLLIV